MNVVGYGGGTDSTAMLIGLWKNHIPVVTTFSPKLLVGPVRLAAR